MGHNFDVDRWEDAALRAAAFFDKHMRSPKNSKPKSSQPGRLPSGAQERSRQVRPGGVGMSR